MTIFGYIKKFISDLFKVCIPCSLFPGSDYSAGFLRNYRFQNGCRV